MKRGYQYIFLFVTAAMLLDVMYRCLDHITRAQPADWAMVFLEQVTGYYGAMALLPVIFRFAERWPFRLTPGRIGVHSATVVCLSVVHTSWMWGSRSLLSPVLGLGKYDYGAMPVRYLMEFPSQLLGYAMAVTAFTIFQKWLRTKDLETQLMSARLENLSHQLQPHFLFNALNAVSATMYEDLGRADRMLERICDFLRATLKLPDSPMVPVSTELALARQYLEVMKARLEDKLTFEIACDELSEWAKVPALLLQPLVENAVEHGQDPVSGRLDIGIDVQHGGGFLNITIRDHGRGVFSNENGHGLANAQKRLGTVYGDRATFRLNTHPDGGALVEIQIPA